MRRASAILAAAALFPLRAALAQPVDQHTGPFLVAAANAGAVGFTDGGPSRILVGGYAYAAFSRLIVGVQGGATPGGAASDLTYGMATLGYPARAIRESLVYPFVGVGGGVLDGGMLPRARTMVFGAGVGADRKLVDDRSSILVGLRGGYLLRRGEGGGRAVYLTVAIGMAGRRTTRQEPPVIVAAGGTR